MKPNLKFNIMQSLKERNEEAQMFKAMLQNETKIYNFKKMRHEEISAIHTQLSNKEALTTRENKCLKEINEFFGFI